MTLPAAAQVDPDLADRLLALIDSDPEAVAAQVRLWLAGDAS